MRVLGVDIGTTGAKALVIDETGAVLGQGYSEYGLQTAPGGQVTQHAADWKNGMIAAVRGALDQAGDGVQAIGLSTQGASMAACANVAEADLVYTWMDGRATAQTDRLAQTVGSDAVYRATGWPLSPGGDAAKVLWLRENGALRGDEKFVSTLGYINHFLTGRFVSDPTNEAIRQLYDFQAGQYDSAILQAIGITADALPAVLPAGAPVGQLCETAARALGLPAGLPVFNGAHDQYCAALGCGAVTPGDMMLATGTTWVVLGVTEKPLFTPSRICPCVHPAGGYGALASQVNAGSVLKWWRAQVGTDYAQMDAMAQQRRETSRDLFFIPYLAGAGFPQADPARRGRIEGLSLHHDQFDIARALMEGVAFEARRTLDEFVKAGMRPGRLIMTGGAAKSDFWVSLVAAVLPEWQVCVSHCADAAPAGAAVLALAGLGAADLRRGAALARLRPVETPAAEEIAYYRQKFTAYTALL